MWSYIKSKTKIGSGIADLCLNPKDTASRKTENDKEKEDILAEFFSSVFTKEPPGQIPELENRKTSVDMLPLVIEREKVTKALLKLNIGKSPGLDNLHPRFMKETAHSLSYPLTIIYNQSLSEGHVPSYVETSTDKRHL